MAKDNKDLSDFDFLKKSVDQYIGTPQAKESVWDKLGRRARRKAMDPLVQDIGWSGVFDGAMNLYSQRKATHDTELATFLAANPEIDSSKLFSGIEDQATEIMKSGNMTYREVVKELAGMHPLHEDYEKLTKQLNEINTNAAQLKEDNDKLLNLKNEIATMDKEDIRNMPSSKRRMYNEIGQGIGDNIKNINGVLVWVDPEDSGIRMRIDETAVSNFDKLPTLEKLGEVLSAGMENGEFKDDEQGQLARHLDVIGNYINPQQVRYRFETSEEIKLLQGALQRLGYNIDYKNKNGKWVRGEDAIDGDMREGGATHAALEQLKKDIESGGGNINKLLNEYKKSDSFKVEENVNPEDYGVKISSLGIEIPKINHEVATKSMNLMNTMASNDLDLTNDVTKSQFDFIMANFWRDIGDEGIYSLIFDGMEGNLAGFASTRPFLEEFIKFKYGENISPEQTEKYLQELMDEDITTSGLKEAFKEWYQDEYIVPKIGTAEADLTDDKLTKKKVNRPPGGGGGDDDDDEKEIPDGIIDYSTGETISEKQLETYYDLDPETIKELDLQPGETYISTDQLDKILEDSPLTEETSEDLSTYTHIKKDSDGKYHGWDPEEESWVDIAASESEGDQTLTDVFEDVDSKVPLIGEGSRLDFLQTVNMQTGKPVGEGETIGTGENTPEFYNGDIFFPGGSLIAFSKTDKNNWTKGAQINDMKIDKDGVLWIYKEGADGIKRDENNKVIASGGKNWSYMNIQKDSKGKKGEMYKMIMEQLNSTLNPDFDKSTIRTVQEGEHREYDSRSKITTQKPRDDAFFAGLDFAVGPEDIHYIAKDGKKYHIDIEDGGDGVMYLDEIYTGSDYADKAFMGPQDSAKYNAIIEDLNENMGFEFETRGEFRVVGADGNLSFYKNDSSLAELVGKGTKVNKNDVYFMDGSITKFFSNEIQNQGGVLFSDTDLESMKKTTYRVRGGGKIQYLDNGEWKDSEFLKKSSGWTDNYYDYDNDWQSYYTKKHGARGIKGHMKIGDRRKTAAYYKLMAELNKQGYRDKNGNRFDSKNPEISVTLGGVDYYFNDLGESNRFQMYSNTVWKTSMDHVFHYNEDNFSMMWNKMFADMQGYWTGGITSLEGTKYGAYGLSSWDKSKPGFHCVVYGDDNGRDDVKFYYYASNGKSYEFRQMEKDVEYTYQGHKYTTDTRFMILAGSLGGAGSTGISVDVSKWKSNKASRYTHELKRQLILWAQKLEQELGSGEPGALDKMTD